MEPIKIKIAREFSSAPGPRYILEGEYSGEAFRKDILSPKFHQAIKEGKKLVVDLDGTAGFGTSFLEESFGGLIRNEGVAYEQIVKTIEIITYEEPYLKDDIDEYLQKAVHEEVA